MARIETWLKCDLQSLVRVQELDGDLFTADNQANRIGVIVTDNGQPAQLVGGTVGYIIRPDEATVIVNGSTSDNRAWIDLPASAYVAKGPISIVIKNGNTTIGACHGYMKRSTTDNIIDPGREIPSLSELLAEIANMRTATAAANTAAGAANSAAGAADTAATNANNKASAANTAAGAANTAATNANGAAVKINDMTVIVTQGDPSLPASATLELVDGHYRITFTNVKGLRGETGDAFHIAKTYDTIAQMEADYSGTDTHIGDYVMVVNSVDDPDNAKVYIKGSTGWRFVVDMSGAQGIKGDTGNGIANASMANYQLTLTFTNGDTYTTPSIRGEKGDKGDTGEDGVSPSVEVTSISGGHRITIEDAEGVHTFDVMDGTNGSNGTDGTNAYCHIRWAANQPTQDSDMSTTPNNYMGVYSGNSATAPTTYTSYQWFKVKGETGSAANVYADTVSMSASDNRKISDVLSGKVNTQQSASDAGKVLGINEDGELEPVPFDGNDFTGATAGKAGKHGYVPAPGAGDQDKLLCGNGTWVNPPTVDAITNTQIDELFS